MPELAEVEFFRKRWRQAAQGQKVRRAQVHAGAKIFANPRAARAIARELPGRTFTSSATAAKQMCFRFGDDCWLGIHLGMSGELRVEPHDFPPQKHDHVVLQMERCALVLNDPRMFGAVDLHVGSDAPLWWTRIAPAILSDAFTVTAVAEFLRRRRRAPIKAVLLLQERFPGVGNWMADEILWRAAIHPRRAAGSLRPAEVRALWRECRRVCRLALDTIAGRGDDLPPDLNVRIPHSWLMPHRWEPGGICPRTRQPLARATIGGRTTCWSPARQKLKPGS